MTTSANSPDGSDSSAPPEVKTQPQQGKPPSLIPGVVLLIIAGVLIVITLIKPEMPRWLSISVAGLAVVVVIALLIYAFKVFRDVTRPGGSR